MFLRNSIQLLKTFSKGQLVQRNNQQLLSSLMKFNFCQSSKQHQHSHADHSNQHVHVHTKDCNHDHDHEHEHDHDHEHHDHDHNHNAEFNQEQISPQDQQIMNSIEEYKKALQFYNKGKFRISHEFFRRTIESIKKSGQSDSSDHLLVLKKQDYNYKLNDLIQK